MPSTLLAPTPQQPSPASSRKRSFSSLFRSHSQSRTSSNKEEIKISRPISVPPPPRFPATTSEIPSPSTSKSRRKLWGSMSSTSSATNSDSTAFSSGYHLVSRPSLEAYSGPGLHSRKPSHSSTKSVDSTSSASRPRPPSPSNQIDDLSLFSPFDPRPVPQPFHSPSPPASQPVFISKSSIAKYKEPSPQAQPHPDYGFPKYEIVPVTLRRDSAQDEEEEQQHNTPLLPDPPRRTSRQIFSPSDGDGVRGMTVWERIGERRARDTGGYVPEGW